MSKLFHQFYHNEEGISLLETAIFLIVLGVTLSVAFPAFMRFMAWRQHNITRERQEHIIASVAAHVLQQGYVPGPADPQAQGSAFGITKPYTDSHDRKGLVPFKTLGLSEVYAKDGYNRYFTYVGRSIRKEKGHAPSFPVGRADFCTTQLDDGFVVESVDGHRHEGVVLILLSHGPNGYGAYQGVSGRLIPDRQAHPSGPAEHYNTEATTHFKEAPYSSEKATYFDDQIMWVTRDNLMAIYAKKPCGPEGGETKSPQNIPNAEEE